VQLLAENLTRSFGSRRIVGPSPSPWSRAGPGRRRTERQRQDDAREGARGPPPPSSGGVFLAGTGSGLPAGRLLGARVGGADLSLYAELTAAENLRFFARLHGRPAGPGWAEERIAAVGLDPSRISAHPIRALSTGQRQRVKLAFATLHEPAVLFLDEPSSNLDDAGRGVVAKVVAEQRGRGLCVVASNDPGDLALADERITL